MKKFKSLLSLLFVMVLMLQMVGPMAFADETANSKDNPWEVKIKANTPYFSGSAYVTNGVLTEPDKLPLTEGTHFDLTINDNGSTVTVTPYALNAEGGVVYSQDVDKYYKPAFEPYTLTKTVISVTATEPVMDLTTGKFSSTYQHTGGTLESGDGLAFDNQPVVSYDESTGKATASVKNSDVKVMNNGTDVTKKYHIVVSGNECDVVSNGKTTIKVEADAPVYYNHDYIANKANGASGLKKDLFEISVNGMIPTVRVYCDFIVYDDGVTVTVTPVDVAVKTADAVMTDLTKYVNFEIKPAVFKKPKVDVYANTPVLNSTGTGYVEAGSRVKFETDALQSAYIQNTIVAVNVSGKVATIGDVVILDGGGGNVTNYFNVVTHPAGVDGGVLPSPTPTTPPTTCPTPTTPPTTTPSKIKLDIMATDADKAYNGKAFTKSQAQGVKFINGTGLLSGHSIGEGLKIQYTRRSDDFTFTDYTDVTKVGTYDKEIVKLSKNVIVDANGNDVTDEYEITTVNGILTIYRAGYVSPDTGDHSNIGLWIALLGVSAVAVAAAVVIILKKNKKA